MTLGIELGSTKIKAVLLDEGYRPVATGSHTWENRLANGIWTYSLEDAHIGVRDCYLNLKKNVQDQYGITLTKIGGLGISGMMHGYLPFDADGNQLAGFRTWRNTMTGQAAEELTELFRFNIPQRWSVAHVYQAILNGEAHVRDIARLDTIATYIHYRLTGQHVAGVGEASGMFPIDSDAVDYHVEMLQKWERNLDSLFEKETFGGLTERPSWKLADILPTVLTAGVTAGALTVEGAAYLDPEGDLKPGIPVAPPEGDAGTGMTATNAVCVRTGNVSAGTSDFAMVVVDKPVGVHPELDMVTTPDGHPVAMVHCNNCTTDINAWVGLFAEFGQEFGLDAGEEEIFSRLFGKALEGEPDCGGLLSFNYDSGEPVTGFISGRPLFMRRPDSRMTLSNFMRNHLMSAMASLKIGLDILRVDEKVEIDKLCGHGGYFKVPGAGQRILSAGAGVPITVMETAGEGGAYGMAILAAYMLKKRAGLEQELGDFLEKYVFAEAESSTVMADAEEVEGFDRYVEAYRKAFPIEQAAVEFF